MAFPTLSLALPSGHQKGDARLRGEYPQAQLGKDDDEDVDEPQRCNMAFQSW